ncbi:unnamed protein product [Heligmosomoides polygyrus]|uniref:Peptidase A1 domain-containing protein n=1 Tax=Heligmosomoides polygyrus TaxID=6339 RepID=A0A183GX55_HELPZ|nr:unnamed protein product [Heligmosomoides polygyrus]
MAGIPVKLVGSAQLKLQIGGSSVEETVHFTDGACIPKESTSYNIILGNNVLAALLPWTFDYGERVLMVKDGAINILSVFPDPVANEKPIAVRVAESTTLKPGTETFVPCYTSRLVETPVMLVAQSSQLQDKSIMVAPAILRSGTMKLLVSNPTERPQLLYKDQRISDGR